MGDYQLLLGLSLILLASFVFNQWQARLRVPAVVILIGCGMALHLIGSYSHFLLQIPSITLRFLGTLGLLVIVLEAVLDIKIHRRNALAVGGAAFFATLIVLLTTALIGGIFKVVYTMSWLSALIYAIPFAIVSSSIVIPSLAALRGRVKFFLVFESIFSDIIGVLLFNMLTANTSPNPSSFALSLINIVVMVVISLAATLLLIWLLNKRNLQNLNVVVLAMVVLIYTLAKHYNLSSLVLVVVFGFLVRNLPLLLATGIGRGLFNINIDEQVVEHNTNRMHAFLDDFCFIIRSLFFILLGYSIQLSELFSIRVILLGIVILSLIYAIRWLVAVKLARLPQPLLAIASAPRGLISVLLFLQIPNEFVQANFDQGLTFFIVVISSIFMAVGIARTPNARIKA